MLDRDESRPARRSSSRSRAGRCSTRPTLVLADIRDREPRRSRSSSEHRPEVVFHAAALKHLPLLEMQPGRGVEDQRRRHPATCSRRREATGVEPLRQHQHRQGGRPDERARVLEADLRAAHGRRRATHDRPAVRVGALRQRARLPGLACSPSFERQIARRRADHGHPPRRDPVLHDRRGGGAARRSRPAPSARPARCSCSTWASRCASPTSPAAWSSSRGEPIRIVYTGLRPGEKLHEVLLGAGEVDERPFHPLISQAPCPRCASTTPWRSTARSGPDDGRGPPAGRSEL